jgi:hypothetical protein
MSRKREGITRRSFLRGTAGATLAGALGQWKARGEEEAGGEAPAPGKARVVLVRDEKAVDGSGHADAAVLGRMLDEAVVALLDKPDPASAWKSLVAPSDVVGIKSNVWRFLRTPVDLEKGLRERLVGAGVKAENIGVDDRGVLRNPIFRRATALINVRPMRTHHWSGVGSLLKNYIMFTEAPADWHGDSCADLAGLWQLPEVKGKTRLNILVMLTPLFHSKGPHDYSPRYIWPYKGLIVSTDPVAADATGLRILEARRREFFGKDQPFEVPPKHIVVAEKKFGLGVADPARIDLVRLGWAEGALI